MRLFRSATGWITDFFKGALGPAGPILFGVLALYLLWKFLGIGALLFLFLILLAVGIQVGDQIFYGGQTSRAREERDDA